MYATQLLAFLCILLTTSFVNANICSNQESEELSFQSSTSGASMQAEPCFDFGAEKFNLNKKVQVDKDVELECFVRNKGVFSVIWMFENQLISLNNQLIRPDSNIKIDSDNNQKFNLRISRVNENYKGSYKCQISTLISQNLEYKLDVLVPPSISRLPSLETISLNEGETLVVQCLTKGNPAPKLTWSKRGQKAEHTKIDEAKNEMTLENVDRTHADTYSCTANNDIGDPVTSEFQVLIKYKPRVSLIEQERLKEGVVYASVGASEEIKCVVDAFPTPKISMLQNNLALPVSSLKLSELSDNQFVLTYNFQSTSDSFGDYVCIGENELGSSSQSILVTPKVLGLAIKASKHHDFSDAIIFDWSALSGSQIQEINVQYFDENNGTNVMSKSKSKHLESSEAILYENDEAEKINYKGQYELTRLAPNTTYTIRIRVKNEFNEWSDWSNNLSVRTHWYDVEKKHHHVYHQRHNNKKHNLHGSSSNVKSERYNNGLYENSAAAVCQSVQLILVNLLLARVLLY